MTFWFQSIISFLVFYIVAFLLSEDRKSVNWRLVLLGVFWHLVFAVLIFKVPAIITAFSKVDHALQVLTSATVKATAFVFGGLADYANTKNNLGFILALQGFPVLIVLSALSSLLIYLKILPFIIKIFSFFFRKTLCVGGTLGVAVSANVFTGMSETPLVITPYLKRLTHSELFSLMVCGTSCISSSVMVLLSVIIGDVLPMSITHIISAVLISIPCALTISRIMVPETSSSLTEGEDADFSEDGNMMEAIFKGVMGGARVLITVIAMLIGFIALIDILNQILGLLPEVHGYPISLQRIIGVIMSPVSWLIGIPAEEMHTAGTLIGSKIIFNEVIALQEFVNLSHLLSAKSKIIMIYALCSFANISSIGVMIGVYNSLVPERRLEVARFGLKSVIAGNLANFLTATLVGVLLSI